MGELFIFHPLMVEIILPFILVFTVVFAILQKTKMFGEDKQQIDALVGLVIGLLTVAFGTSTKIIINLMPIFAVAVVSILIFMLLYGMVFKDLLEGNKVAKLIIGIGSAIVVAVALIKLTGFWTYLIELADTSTIVTNVIIAIVVIVAIVVVVVGGKVAKDK